MPARGPQQPEEGAAAVAATGRQTTWDFAFAEKAIMACKASAMNDLKSLDLIVAATTPMEAKLLGRNISSFDEDVWAALACGVACDVVHAKFSNGPPELAKVLVDTGDKLLAEAAHKDIVWGIGLAANDNRVQTPSQWPGANVLGYALMQVRNVLQEKIKSSNIAAANTSAGILVASQQGQGKTAVTQDLVDHMTSLRAAMRWKQAGADLPAQQAVAAAMIELEIHATHSVAAGSALRGGARNAPVPGVVSAAAHDWYNNASTGTHNPAAWAKV